MNEALTRFTGILTSAENLFRSDKKWQKKKLLQ